MLENSQVVNKNQENLNNEENIVPDNCNNNKVDKIMNNELILDNFETIFDKTKLPNKKLNFKQYAYKKRISYGRLSTMGLVNDNARYIQLSGVLNRNLIAEGQNNINGKTDNEKIQIHTDMKRKCNNHMTGDDAMLTSPLDDNFYRSLYYCSELNFNLREQRREGKLKQMLNEKLILLMELKKLKSNKLNKLS
jgi:hypothetical protein